MLTGYQGVNRNVEGHVSVSGSSLTHNAGEREGERRREREFNVLKKFF